MSATLYMLKEQTTTQMMSYVLQTSEGKLAVIDGGNRVDAENLLETLIRLGGPEPEVELWLMTHPHSDHIGAFLEIFAKHSPIRVKKVYDCVLPYDFYAENEAEAVLSNEFLRELEVLKVRMPEMFAEFAEGQILEMGSVKFRVLYVPDGSIKENAYNNASTVIRLDAEGQRLLFLGDLGKEAGDYVLCHVPAEELKADFVQMAHHGQNGVGENFYEAVSPSVCLWNTPYWLWENNAGEGNGTGPWKTLEVRAWMKKIGVRHHFVTKDGEHAIGLPFGVNQPRKEYGLSIGFPNEEVFKSGLFKCVEFCRANIYGEEGFENVEKDARELAELSQKYHVAVRSFHIPFGSNDESFKFAPASLDAGERENTLIYTKRLIESLLPTGIEYVVLHGSLRVLDEDRPEHLEAFVEYLQKLSDYCKPLGIRIAVETLKPRCIGNGLKEHLYIKEHVKRDNVGICFDSNHLLNEDNLAFLEGAGQHVFTTHLSDFDGEDERHWYPGRGISNWKETVRILEEKDYTGPWVFEVSFPDGIATIEECQTLIAEWEALFA